MSNKEITGLIFLLLGVRGAGKTTLLNVLISMLLKRQAGLDGNGYPRKMTVRITTRKHSLDDEDEEGEDDTSVEFRPLNDYYYGNFVDLNRAGLINIFDPKMGMSEWDILETAVNVCELANNNVRLNRWQPLALQVGVHKMLTQSATISSPEVLEVILRALTADDLTHYFAHSNSEVLRRLQPVLDEDPNLKEQLQLTMELPHNIPIEEFKQDGALNSTQLGRVTRGEFGQAFGGVNSLHDVLESRITTLNMTGMNMKARTLTESMLWKWNTIALTQKRYTLVPGMNVGDEEHEGVTSLMYMRFWAQNVAKARSIPTADFRATQLQNQLTEAGDAGSELRSLAKQINQGIGGHFIGKIADDETARNDLSNLGVSDQDVNAAVNFEPGEMAFKIPGRPLFPFKVLRTPTVIKLAETDQAADRMNRFAPVMSFRAIRERAYRVGMIQLGEEED